MYLLEENLEQYLHNQRVYRFADGIRKEITIKEKADKSQTPSKFKASFH